MAPQRPNVTDLYFVGFAGYAYEDVFLRQVRTIRRMFDDRFDTESRSLALLNHLETVEDTPIASRHNLSAVLMGLGRNIDPEEDVVFLFLTSHGSPNHRLAVEFDPLGLNYLSPDYLRSMLDEAGIKYCVIVVSACYSGGFIEPLRDENSLIITASRHDRTSFGCSNERDFTYFGEAYFRDQLSHNDSFVDAFWQAQVAIVERETSEGLTSSLPQIHIGIAIEQRLHELEQRWRSKRDTALHSNAD